MIYNENNPEGFTTDVNSDEDDSPLTHSGADIIASDEVTIETSSPPGCSFRVMALMFTVIPEDEDSPVTITVTFVDMNGGPGEEFTFVSLIS